MRAKRRRDAVYFTALICNDAIVACLAGDMPIRRQMLAAMPSHMPYYFTPASVARLAQYRSASYTLDIYAGATSKDDGRPRHQYRRYYSQVKMSS